MALTKAEIRQWYAGKTFAAAMTLTRKGFVWQDALEPLRETAQNVLEIGSFEGQSALFFLNYFPRATLVCVDPFYSDGLEAVFDRNVKEFSRRLEKIVDFSFPALTRLRQEKRMFDVIYIDGLHQREAVLLDSVLSWPMLRENGVLIWDDYGAYKKGAPAAERPQPAIDGFLVAYAGDYEEIHRGSQMLVRKTVDGPVPKLRTSLQASAPSKRPAKRWSKLLGPLGRSRPPKSRR